MTIRYRVGHAYNSKKKKKKEIKERKSGKTIESKKIKITENNITKVRSFLGVRKKTIQIFTGGTKKKKKRSK